MASPVEFVLSIVQSLVDHPEQAMARWVVGSRGGTVQIKVAPNDRGKIIGKNGTTIRSLRRLTNAALSQNGEPVGVELVE